MLDQTNADPQANEGADNTADQMTDEVDIDAVDQIEDVEELRKQLRTTLGQKKHFREKYEKLSSDPRFKEPEKKPEPKKESKKQDNFDPEAFRQEVIAETLVRQKYPAMTDEEMSRAKGLAKLEGKPLSEMVEDTYFQAYLKANEERRTAERARPSPSNRSGSPSTGSIDDLADPQKVAQMDPETFAKLSEQAGKQSRYKIISRN